MYCYCICMVIYFWQDFISCHVKKSIFLADCICLFLQANQIVECQSIKSVGVAEFSIFLSISSRREDLVSLSSTTDFSSIFQSCAALGEILQSRINPLSWKKTHFDTLAFSKNRNHSKVETYCLPKIAAHQKWVFNRKAENNWDEAFLAN